MKSRYLVTALAAALFVALPVLAAEQPMQPAAQTSESPQPNEVRGTRLSEGTIKGINYFIDIIDGRPMFAKMGVKPDFTHHIAIMTMDMKAKKPVAGAKATLKCIPAAGKAMTWKLDYKADMQHVGQDLTLEPGNYTFEGTITFRGEKKTFKAKYQIEK